MVAAVSRLLVDAGERGRISAHALQMVRERFSLTRMIEETEKVYVEALSET
jgi:glycosyltransferase involved in cell wall biosynthesis